MNKHPHLSPSIVTIFTEVPGLGLGSHGDVTPGNRVDSSSGTYCWQRVDTKEKGYSPARGRDQGHLKLTGKQQAGEGRKDSLQTTGRKESGSI